MFRRKCNYKEREKYPYKIFIYVIDRQFYK